VNQTGEINHILIMQSINYLNLSPTAVPKLTKYFFDQLYLGVNETA
jgi:hypothetical protein